MACQPKIAELEQPCVGVLPPRRPRLSQGGANAASQEGCCLSGGLRRVRASRLDSFRSRCCTLRLWRNATALRSCSARRFTCQAQQPRDCALQSKRCIPHPARLAFAEGLPPRIHQAR